MNPGALYHPGTSLPHRLPVGGKLVGLLGFAALVFVARSPWWLGGGVLVVAVGYALARVPPASWSRLVRSLLVLLVPLFAVQWWLIGLDSATVVCLRLAATLGMANLFTLTTRIDDLVDAIERATRPLHRFGVRPDRFGLLVGFTVQAVAALTGIAADVREAQRARGMDRSVVAFAVPFLVRTLRHADELGEALAARGVADD
ncbi:MAG: energy-coupling factor transporter transmembrane protein EcfT [Kutzneria sp.]|nr:energy-coupling factor transporter transmembrane protein EcfT [Kutzneria sp.]MBV9845630.1 energy-coupling factor transporter transmembrane protein EcfT [Kutzneria sp.]